MTLLDRAIATVNGTGSGGPEFAGTECTAAYASGVTPSQIMEGVRKRATKSGKLSQFRTHEGIVWGSYSLYTLGAEHFTVEGDKFSPMGNAIRWANRLGVSTVRTVLDSDREAADKADQLRLLFEQKLAEAAKQAAENAALKRTPGAIALEVQGRVESLLNLRDANGAFEPEVEQMLASILEDLRVVIGIQVGADA